METSKRSLAKTVSWRVVATTTTMVLVYAFTGEFLIVASVGLWEVVSKMTLYFAHERIWSLIGWGRGDET